MMATHSFERKIGRDFTMAKEIIILGASPYLEDCSQVGEDNYTTRAFQECKIYIAQLTRMYCQAFEKDLPDNCSLKVKGTNGNFGISYDVAVVFESDDYYATEAANWLAVTIPSYYDDIAKQEIREIPSNNEWTL